MIERKMKNSNPTPKKWLMVQDLEEREFSNNFEMTL
jgi:hypothetical protein